MESEGSPKENAIIRTDNILQGVGDDVFAAVVTFVVVFMTILYFLLKQRPAQPNVRDTEEDTNRTLPNGDLPVQPEQREEQAPIVAGENCPICLGPAVGPIETNCGHRFCGEMAFTLTFIENFLSTSYYF